MSISSRLFVLPLLVFAFAGVAAGPAVPPMPTRFVTDKAGVIPPDVAAGLEERLRSFERDTSNQFLVYTEPTVPEGTTIEEYTVACAQAWKAGQKQRKNGMILFVFPLSRKVRLEVGYGLEGAMPDALAHRVIDEQVLPRLRTGDYGGGITAGVTAAIAATKGEYVGTGRTRREADGRSDGRSGPHLLTILFFVALFLLSLRWRIPFFFIGGGGFGSGGGFGGGGGGGGFSGGGGSFGGGGASGSW